MPDLKKKRTTGSTDLTREVTDLKWAVVRAVELYRSRMQTRRALALSFLKGVTSALGAIATVVIVLPAIVWALRSVAWPPLIADFVTKITLQIEQSNRPLSPAAADR